MNTAVHYRKKAEELVALAGQETNPNLQAAFAAIAQSYLRLAVLAEQNSKTGNVETPAAHPQAVPA
jgi:hypothetical protein